MSGPNAVQILLGFLCLNGTLFCRGADRYDCFSLKNNVRFKTGDFVTTKSYGSKLWCGSKKGEFLAVSNTELLYLKCSRDAEDPKEATVTIFDVRKLSSQSEIFHSGEKCITTGGKQGQAGGMTALAQKLSEVTVPYNRMNCNSQHYFQYLSQGSVNKKLETAPNCPVFSTFTDAQSVQSNAFRLADKESYYNWPVTSMLWGRNSAKKLTIAEKKAMLKPPLTVPNGSTRGSRGSWKRGSSRGWGRRMSGNSSNGLQTQRQIDTESRFTRGGGGTGGWGNPTNPIGTGGQTSTSYPAAGAYGYTHGHNTSAASRLSPPLYLNALGGAVRGGLRMIGH